MTEVVTIGAATLYCGDCTEIFSILENVDHTISDPPYERISQDSWGIKNIIDRDDLKVKLTFDAIDNIRARVTKETIRLSNGWVLYFCQAEGVRAWRDEIAIAGARYKSAMLWIKPDAKPEFIGNRPAVGYEMIVCAWCNDGQSKWNGGGRAGTFIYSGDRGDKRDHPTQKPMALMTELVGLFTNKNELIFDPFMGSGSTGVAAVSMGRRFIGIEKDPKYFEIACRRIEKAQEEGLLNAPYVKTKAKITVPLLDIVKEAPIAKVKAPKIERVASVGQQPKKLGLPTIINARKMVDIVPEPVKPPFINAFLEANAAILREHADKLLAFNEWSAADPPSPIGMDVECFQNYFLICFKRFTDGKRLSFELSERAPKLNTERLLNIIKSNLIVTFNGQTYDLPLIWLALRGATVAQLKLATDRIIKGGLKYWDVERELGIKIPILNHIDLLEPNPSVRQSLKTLAGRLHQRFLVDLPFEEDTWLTHAQMNIVTLYCFNDLDSTQLLYDAMREPLELRVALSREYKMDLRSKSDAQIGEVIVRKRVEEARGRRIEKTNPTYSSFQYDVPGFITFEDDRLNALLRDLRSTRFTIDGSGRVVTPPLLEKCIIEIGGTPYSMGIGGLHSMEVHRAVHADNEYGLIDIDVASQYPNIIMKLGFYPKAIGPVFLPVYGKIIAERLEAKREQQRVEKEIRDLEAQLAQLAKLENV